MTELRNPPDYFKGHYDDLIHILAYKMFNVSNCGATIQSPRLKKEELQESQVCPKCKEKQEELECFNGLVISADCKKHDKPFRLGDELNKAIAEYKESKAKQ